MLRALVVISIGSFTMAVLALLALEIPGSHFELGIIASLITVVITTFVFMATRFTATPRRPKARKRVRRVFGATRPGVAADLRPNALRHR